MTGEPRGITFTRQARKGISTLPEHVLEPCKNILRELAAGTARGKKLKGDLKDLTSIRLGQGHRIIYRESLKEIQVVDVGPRGDIYKG
jgi:mRNA-degrading endonuclease RelE of RelBE toxin-antitoxin system